MLTSTEAIAARHFTVSLRDPIDARQVDAFMDRVINTLMYYERSGRFAPNGVTAEEAAELEFPSASGQGYNRGAFEKVRQQAIEALKYYEASLNKTPGSSKNRIESRVSTSSSPSAPYVTPRNGFQPPASYGTANVDFEVPTLEDTISAPIRRPQPVEHEPVPQSEPALLTSEIAQVLYEAPHIPAIEDTGILDPITPDTSSIHIAYNASLGPAHFQSVGYEPSPHTPVSPSAGSPRTASQPFTPESHTLPITTQAQAPSTVRTVRQGAPSPETPPSAQSPERVSGAQALYAPPVSILEEPFPLPSSSRSAHSSTTAKSPGSSRSAATNSQPVVQGGAPLQQRLSARQPALSAPQSVVDPQPQPLPQARMQQTGAHPAAPVRAGTPTRDTEPSGEHTGAIDAATVLEQLVKVLQTKEVLAQRSPQTHSVDGTVRINTSAGALEVTAVRLHSSGQIYLETQPAK